MQRTMAITLGLFAAWTCHDIQELATMREWFSDDKGYGFITPDESGKDLSSITPGSAATAMSRWRRAPGVL
jgi:hypothetical protein